MKESPRKFSYTVIISRPPAVSEATHVENRLDVVVWSCMAKNSTDAVKVAQMDVYARDKQDVFTDEMKDGRHRIDVEDYRPVLVFEGHFFAVMYGWAVDKVKFQEEPT